MSFHRSEMCPVGLFFKLYVGHSDQVKLFGLCGKELVINTRGNTTLRSHVGGLGLSAALMFTPLFFSLHAQI